jgi:FAD/FMN-containing dehydrogenase
MSMLYSDADLDAMKKLRVAFNPDELCNPGKIFPLHRCGYEKS